jgi:hypothetical protein
LPKRRTLFRFFSFDSQNVALEIAQFSPFLPLYLHLLSFVPLLDRRAGGFTLPYLDLTFLFWCRLSIGLRGKDEREGRRMEGKPAREVMYEFNTRSNQSI